MTLFLDDGDVRLYHGDALETVRAMPDESVDCVVTSPPYWGLRDYGVDGQMGLEESPDAFVAEMVELFREIRRVLAPHGTCWVNLGDSYSGGKTGRSDHGTGDPTSRLGPDRDGLPRGTAIGDPMQRPVPPGFKPKDLVGIPWRVAFALQADGWWLRSDIIWAKPNPMPESVTDRPTKAHEYVFLLTKSPRYWFDTEAVREPHSPDGRKQTAHIHATDNSHPNYDNIGNRNERWPNGGRNVRSVWNIATQPYPDAHFATFPEELARRCILAGCPERVCLVCGKPSERIVDTSYDAEGRTTNGPRSLEQRHETAGFSQRLVKSTSTVGWSDCECRTVHQTDVTRVVMANVDKWRPGVVLDPFIGSGTTAKVARDHQRHAIGIDLNQQYLELAARRLQQLSLLNAL